MARYTKQNNIPFVIPFKSNNKVLFSNPQIFKTTASNMTLIDGMIDFIVDKYSHYNITIMKPTATADKALFEKARDRYNTKITSVNNALTPSIIELNLGNSNGRDLNVRLRKDTTNVIIVPSNDVKYVSEVFKRLNNVINLNPYAKNMKIIVFGFEDWNKLKDIDLNQRNRVHQHYATYRYVDFNANQTKKLLLSYRKKYKTDPDIYGVQGFDVGYYFLSALHLYGQNFKQFLPNHNVKLIQNNFKFNDINSPNGQENSCVKIIEYSNYTLIEK